ncbi:hypothetical protein PCASD_22476 [Puccinia coronata f. sp. avenae]|uniref:Uncharacterized protein n=1 Tax=Puccinia coronata f. sp. avenae TaxID=200324 RepID=A0A2N5S6B1_9BASI|nr:hypothetical protein PCASD_22476 [Puccinia coronata f. sp. avenae]
MNNSTIAPNLENYHLDENGQIMIRNDSHAPHGAQFGSGTSTQQNFDPLTNVVPNSTQEQFAIGTHVNRDQSTNGIHDNGGTHPPNQISSSRGARGRGRGRGRGCGRGRGGGSGRGRASKNTSSRGGQRNVTFAQGTDKDQTATASPSSHPNQNVASSQQNVNQNAASPQQNVIAQSSQTSSGLQTNARINLDTRLSQGTSDAVRQVLFATGKGRRLTARIKDELKHLTLEYQKKIHELAITYELRSEILFKWVGGFNKMKGPNRFNNYCRYGREPREIFASNINFLNDLRRCLGLPGTDDPEDIEDEDWEEASQIEEEFNQSTNSSNQHHSLIASKVKVPQASKSGAEALKVCKKWINQVTEDFNHLRADHQVEGFVIVVSSDSLGSVFLRGGTPLGEEYMDMLKAKYECWKKFHIWVTGMAVDGELTLGADQSRDHDMRLNRKSSHGKRAKCWTSGRKCAHNSEPYFASSGRTSRGWPAQARGSFEKWGLVLKIKPDAVEPSTGVNLQKTLLDGDPSFYSKDEIDAVREALHFDWILLSKKDNQTDSCGLQGAGSEPQVEGSATKNNQNGEPQVEGSATENNQNGGDEANQ